VEIELFSLGLGPQCSEGVSEVSIGFNEVVLDMEGTKVGDKVLIH